VARILPFLQIPLARGSNEGAPLARIATAERLLTGSGDLEKDGTATVVCSTARASFSAIQVAPGRRRDGKVVTIRDTDRSLSWPASPVRRSAGGPCRANTALGTAEDSEWI
jgi:hypothetical protein